MEIQHENRLSVYFSIAWVFFKNKIYGQTWFLGGDQKPTCLFPGQPKYCKWGGKKKKNPLCTVCR